MLIIDDLPDSGACAALTDPIRQALTTFATYRPFALLQVDAVSPGAEYPAGRVSVTGIGSGCVLTLHADATGPDEPARIHQLRLEAADVTTIDRLEPADDTPPALSDEGTVGWAARIAWRTPSGHASCEFGTSPNLGQDAESRWVAGTPDAVALGPAAPVR